MGAKALSLAENNSITEVIEVSRFEALDIGELNAKFAWYSSVLELKN